jgi:hypothetical protein
MIKRSAISAFSSILWRYCYLMFLTINEWRYFRASFDKFRTVAALLFSPSLTNSV